MLLIIPQWLGMHELALISLLSFFDRGVMFMAQAEHSLTFCNCSILTRVTGTLSLSQGPTGERQELTLDGMPAHHRALTTHTPFPHTLAPSVNFETPIHMLLDCGRNWSPPSLLDENFLPALIHPWINIYLSEK